MTNLSDKLIKQDVNQSVQAGLTSDNRANTIISFGRVWDSCDLIPSPWWSEQRERDLEAFVKLRGNDMLQSAIASFTKRFSSMSWYVNGPEKPTLDWYLRLQQCDFGKGLSDLIARTVQKYCVSDKGVFWELIGPGDPETELKEVQSVAYLDGDYCIPTGDVDYPVIFTKTKNGKAIKMHRTRVVHFVDMESPSRDMNGVGFSAVSRVIQSSSIMLRLAKYKDEKLKDLPEAGLLLFNNILPTRWDEKLEEHETHREQLGQMYWSNMITMFGLDPTQPATAEFISFANMPEHFDELQQTEFYAQNIALSLGISVQEIWSLKGSAWNPTATEINIQQEQGKNKGIGNLVKQLERAINWYILPKVINFNFDFIDDAEDMKNTTINVKKIEAIMALYRPPTAQQFEVGIRQPISNEVIQRLLSQEVTWFDEGWFDDALGDDKVTFLSEADKEFYLGKQVKISSEGKLQRSYNLAS